MTPPEGIKPGHFITLTLDFSLDLLEEDLSHGDYLEGVLPAEARMIRECKHVLEEFAPELAAKATEDHSV